MDTYGYLNLCQMPPLMGRSRLGCCLQVCTYLSIYLSIYIYVCMYELSQCLGVDRSGWEMVANFFKLSPVARQNWKGLGSAVLSDK